MAWAEHTDATQLMLLSATPATLRPARHAWIVRAEQPGRTQDGKSLSLRLVSRPLLARYSRHQHRDGKRVVLIAFDMAEILEPGAHGSSLRVGRSGSRSAQGRFARDP